MNEQRTTTIGSLVGKGVLELGDGYRTKRPELGTPGLPILRVAEVLNGKISPSFTDHVHESHAAKMGNKISQSHDIILTTKGTVGRVAIIPEESPSFVYSPQVCYFRTTESKILDRKYLYYWFKSEQFWSQASSLMSQTDMAAYLNLTDIRSLKITLPRIDIQKRTSEVLSALDEKITANERIASTSDELCQLLASTETSKSPRTTIESICTLNKKQVAPASLESPIVEHYSLPAFDKGRLPEITNPGNIKSSKFIVTRPSVLISKLNPHIPRVWNVPKVGGVPKLASTEFLALEPTSDVNTHELWAVASQSEFTSSLSARVIGTSKSHQRVRPEEVLTTEVVDPRRLGPARGQIAALSSQSIAAIAESRALAELRDTLLPQLMSGKLRVKDAEKIVEDNV